MYRGLIHLGLVIAAMPICFFQPFTGLLIYLWFAHAHIDSFVYDAFMYGGGSGQLFATALLAGYGFFELRYSPPRLRGMKLLAVFWAWLAVSTLFAYDRDLALSKLWQYSSIFIIAFLVAALANSEERIRQLLYAVSVSLAIIGTKSALLTMLVAGHRVQGPGGMVLEENEYALALDLTIPILFWLARTERRPWLRFLLFAMSAGCVITVIATRSRSGFLGLVLTLLLLTAYAKRKLLAVVALPAAAAIFLVFFSKSSALERYRTITTNTEELDRSAIGRLEAWKTALNMVRTHPFFGVGLRNFEPTFSRFSNYQPRAAHNALLALAAETGVPGLLLFALMIGTVSWRMLRLKQLLPATPENESIRNYCLILHCDFLIFIVPNLFNTRQDYDLFYHLLGLSAGLAWVCEQRLSAQPEAPAVFALEAEAVPSR